MNPILKSVLMRLWKVVLFGGIALGGEYVVAQIPSLVALTPQFWQSLWVIVGGAVLTAIDKGIRAAKAEAAGK
jgi:hypothetical protein